MLKNRIEQALESSTSALRESDQRIAQYRQMLDKETAFLLETSGEIKGIRKVLRMIEEEEAGASNADAEAGEKGDEGTNDG